MNLIITGSTSCDSTMYYSRNSRLLWLPLPLVPPSLSPFPKNSARQPPDKAFVIVLGTPCKIERWSRDQRRRRARRQGRLESREEDLRSGRYSLTPAWNRGGGKKGAEYDPS